jgi:NADPH2:quinone reductase
MKAIGLNFPDMLLVEGKYQVKPELPAVPCMEGMGVVEKAGPGSAFAVGQRVIVGNINGLMAERVSSPDSALATVPDGMPDDEAAAFQVIYQTSYFGLVRRAQLKSGETLLVHGAGGGVGTSAVQLGRALGATVFATAKGEAKCRIAAECGAAHVFDTSKTDWVTQVKTLTEGRGVDVVYDPVGGETFDKSFKVIALEGRVLVIGFASGVIPNIAANRVLLKNCSVVGLQWGAYRLVDPAKVVAAHAALSELYVQKKIKPVLYPKRYGFGELLKAFEALSSREAYGKVVVTVD